MAKLTVKEVKRIAAKNYNNGGDAIIECYSDKDIQELIDNGLTFEGLVSMFVIRMEEFKAAMYFSGGSCEVKEDEGKDDFDEEENERYVRSSCSDYSPSCPWNAPGMSPSDFIR